MANSNATASTRRGECEQDRLQHEAAEDASRGQPDRLQDGEVPAALEGGEVHHRGDDPRSHRPEQPPDEADGLLRLVHGPGEVDLNVVIREHREAGGCPGRRALGDDRRGEGSAAEAELLSVIERDHHGRDAGEVGHSTVTAATRKVVPLRSTASPRWRPRLESTTAVRCPSVRPGGRADPAVHDPDHVDVARARRRRGRPQRWRSGLLAPRRAAVRTSRGAARPGRRSGPVNGPRLPREISQESAWNERTVRLISLSKLELTPDSKGERKHHARGDHCDQEPAATPLEIAERDQPHGRADATPVPDAMQHLRPGYLREAVVGGSADSSRGARIRTGDLLSERRSCRQEQPSRILPSVRLSRLGQRPHGPRSRWCAPVVPQS